MRWKHLQTTVGYCKYLHWSYIAGCLVQDPLHLNLCQSLIATKAMERLRLKYVSSGLEFVCL